MASRDGRKGQVLLLCQGGVINHKAVMNIAFEHALVSLVNLLSTDHFHVCDNPMFCSEIQHLLGFRDAADHRTGNGPALHNEVKDFW